MFNTTVAVLALAGIIAIACLAGWAYTLTRLTAFLTPALNVRREAARLADEIDARVSRRIAMINERNEETDALGLPPLPGFNSSMLEQPTADDSITRRLRREIEEMTSSGVPEGREKEPFMVEV